MASNGTGHHLNELHPLTAKFSTPMTVGLPTTSLGKLALV
jgi:hypothetical protein